MPHAKTCQVIRAVSSVVVIGHGRGTELTVRTLTSAQLKHINVIFPHNVKITRMATRVSVLQDMLVMVSIATTLTNVQSQTKSAVHLTNSKS